MWDIFLAIIVIVLVFYMIVPHMRSDGFEDLIRRSESD
jgi:hypothetical protein